MKKIILTVAALVGTIGVSLASQRGYRPARHAHDHQHGCHQRVPCPARLPPSAAPAISNFDRLNATAQENLEVRH